MSNIDVINKKFGKLTVIEFVGIINKYSSYKCLCECGKTSIVRRNNLLSGNSKSCGCRKHNGEAHIIHHMTKTKPYILWCSMKRRCENRNTSNYSRYGAKGIAVCDKWQTFEGFWEDMQNGYIEGLSIDRIDNSGNYYKENCRWVTMKEQANNKSTNCFIIYNNKKQTLAQWCEELGLLYWKVNQRIRRGWDAKKAFLTP